MIVVWSADARQDLYNIERYLIEANPNAAARILDDIIQAGERLRDFPRRARPSRLKARRELRVLRQPYFLLYRGLKENVEILRVIHESRDWPQAE